MVTDEAGARELAKMRAQSTYFRRFRHQHVPKQASCTGLRKDTSEYDQKVRDWTQGLVEQRKPVNWTEAEKQRRKIRQKVES